MLATSDLLNRAVARHRDGRADEAEALYRLTLAKAPDEPNALFMLATIDRGRGDHPAALDKLYRACAGAPRRADIHAALGDVQRTIGDHDRAHAAYDKAIAIAPDAASGWLRKAELYLAQDNPNAAAQCLTDGLRFHPHDCDMLDLCGVADVHADRLGHAERVFGLARKLAPERRDLALKHGAACLELGRIQSAIEAFQLWRQDGPENAAVETEMGLALLAAGRLNEGWTAYQARWRVKGKPPPESFTKRAWDGAPVAGKRVLICAEQGIGDQIMFAAGIPALSKAIGSDGTLVLECAPKVMRLFARSWPDVRIEPTRSKSGDGATIHASYGWLAGHEPVDVVGFMADLPRYLLDQCTGDSYLSVDPSLLARWRTWLATLGSGPKIGINARSSLSSPHRDGRAPPIQAWREVFAAIPDACFINLQYDDQEGACWNAVQRETRTSINVPPGLDQFDDLDGVAALIAGLDLVIAAPTAVVSLAGAVGTPTLRLIRGTDWSLFGRAASPFHRSVETIILARDWYGPPAMAPVTAAARRLVNRP